MEAIQNKGYTDRPAKTDNFEIERYIVGLTKFIRTCNTPITMAIQGDWGTGKTSIMSMVYDRLKAEKNLHLVWFNTWQFSQFNMGDKLPILMMNKLISSVSGKNNEHTKEVAAKAAKILGDVLLGYLTNGTTSTGNLFEGNDSLTGFVDAVDKLKDNFQELVNKKAGEFGRVVIFIDDLDRLQPGKAVELLEVLKVFLDCEKCVFVLAIDYGVVARGVKEKYGEDFSDEKGKNFFDKIIQVPFKMPVADYNISSYVKEGLKTCGIEIDDSSLSVYVDLINDSIGNNPRSMKRLFNSYLLLSKIASDKLLEEQSNCLILFALLCMQSQYEGVYNHLIRNRESIEAEQIMGLMEPDNPLFAELKMGKKEIEQFNNFAKAFNEVINTDPKDDINEAELAVFRRVLGFSAITSSSGDSNMGQDEGEYRWRHKDRCRKYLPIIQKRFPDIFFKEYYTRTHDKASWWIYTPNHAKTPSGRGFSYEFRFDPVEDKLEMKSSMTIYLIRENNKHTIQDILSEIGENPLPDLGVAPTVVEQWGVCYKNVAIFETRSSESDALLLDLICKSIEPVKQYFQ